MGTDNAKTTHDLAIIGPVPPPYGGVTVHIGRLLGHLEAAGIDYVVYNISPEPTSGERIRAVAPQGWRWFARYLRRGREPVVYVHSSRWDVWAATWLLSRVRGKVVIIAVHTDSLRRLWPERGWLARRAVRAAFRAADCLVAVNEHIRAFLGEVAGVADKTVVIPAFVEPVPRAEDEASIDPAVRSFCKSHDPVLLANGAPIVYDDGRDLYGIDMTIDLVEQLRSTWPRIGVLWYTLKFTGWNPEYAAEVAEEVRRRDLTPHWLFAEPTGEMYPVFGDVTLFVRPTCSDGDAVSVREALHFGVPVVASDAAPRPEGARVFRTRDQDDFVAKVRAALEHLDEERARLTNLPTGSEVDEEVELLRRAIERTRRKE